MAIIQASRMPIMCLAFLGLACSENETRPTSNNCALPENPAAVGDQLLVTGVESAGQMKLAFAPDKCQEFLQNVYLKPHAIHEIEYALRNMPSREFDDVKVGILDGSVISAEAIIDSEREEITLIDEVTGIHSLSDSDVRETGRKRKAVSDAK